MYKIHYKISYSYEFHAYKMYAISIDNKKHMKYAKTAQTTSYIDS